MRDFTDDLRELRRRLDEAETYLRVGELRNRLVELEAEMGRPDLWDDAEQAKALTGEYANVRDDLANDATKAQIRVINAAEGFDEIDVRRKGIEDDDLFSGVNVGSEAGFKAIDPWAGTLEFRAEDGKRLLASLPKVDLQAGKSYTIILAPGKSGKLDAFWFEDAPTM